MSPQSPPPAGAGRASRSRRPPSGIRSSRRGTSGVRLRLPAAPSADLDQEPDPGPLLAVDGDVDERRYADDVDTARCDIATRYRDCLDRLVDRAGADRLDLDSGLASDHTGDGARDGDRFGRGRHLE